MDGEQFAGLKDIWKAKIDAKPAVLTREEFDAFLDRLRRDLFEEPQESRQIMSPGEYFYWKQKLEEAQQP